MESGNAPCMIYRNNNNFLPSLTDDHRRFLISPATGTVISGRPDMVFGLGKQRDNTEDTIDFSGTVTLPEEPGSHVGQSGEIVSGSTGAMTTSNELAALKAEIIKEGGVEIAEMYKEPEHSFLRANSEEGMSEIYDSVSQYVSKNDGRLSKENSFARPLGNPNQIHIEESVADLDDQKNWEEAIEKHKNLDETSPAVQNIPQKLSRQGSAHVRLPSGSDDKSNYWEKGRQYRRVPAKLIRLASLSARNNKDSNGQSTFYSPPKPTPKVISLDDAINARPPLRIDMEGPTPCSYSPRNKPLHEKNSPSWTFGQKCYVEKIGGARTSWGKIWFQTPHVWHNKVDFNAEAEWPSPTHYPQPPTLGTKQATTIESPAFTFGSKPKKSSSLIKPGSENMPSPVDYDRQLADRQTHERHPAFTHQFRRDGTVLWETIEPTPGPGAYSPRSTRSTGLHRSFTIAGMRREKSHFLGPFSHL
ncbi:uncharacterized protein LOC126812613 [Patella vulgata]|uniref:uncharacterized protein LOC126812613 n=1 Tax=Patella vulgata TaxID=6465 RepID=UPI0024A853C4|nr:uncharacterized protein LOC126812613 [Patella vulgata]